MRQQVTQRMKALYKIPKGRMTLAFYGVFIAFFSLQAFGLPGFLAYPLYAPPNWYNANVHIREFAGQYAVSHDIPGLILACGTGRCYRTRDGGNSWSPIHVPTTESPQVMVPMGGQGTFFVTNTFCLSKMGCASYHMWVSHNAGDSWQEIAIQPNLSVLDAWDAIGKSIYRAGKLYTLQSNKDSHTYIAMSTDDGSAWVPMKSDTSEREQQKWSVRSFAMDYSSMQGWYRLLTPTDHSSSAGTRASTPPAYLEHSTDDGHTWQGIGPVGDIAADGVSMATSPARPQRLCVANDRRSSLHVEDPPVITASADGGQTWRQVLAHAPEPHASGVLLLPIQMGDDGSCYTVHFQMTRNPRDTATSETVTGNEITTTTIWRLPPLSTTLETVFVSQDYNLGVNLVTQTGFAYVPHGNHQQARLVLSADNFTLAWWEHIVPKPDYHFLLWTALSE